MSRVPIDVSAAERARWLAELAEALDQAQRLVWTLGASVPRTAEVMELYGRLDSAQAEVQMLRFRRGNGNREPDSVWPELPWQRSGVERGG